ncbi:MAG: hypothetical protein CL424_05715 [Acidimicrobiaceae bacterium]|nr:hypothetical protein [Acidimicrobiaceae bacterium]
MARMISSADESLSTKPAAPGCTEVFLLSRIEEGHDRTGDNVTAVALGLERAGRIVTAGALLLSIRFFAFATSGVTFIKMFGLGLAILMDAFVIRGTLGPAFMKLAGVRAPLDLVLTCAVLAR